ncbi:hypothetical protein DKM44_07140 [Deinococcus irradiatisoli]|uniref:Uncharacterized protein n=1 Tax=Deinococcus irradiatisoli TaxID=2202254 RepID=A0A2Z3JHK1_9DEIO|nr:hypothetical protein [Deinococcus irradiatisoli]AWN23031.1 hypothetical protein DKM44_07140 [Deinococcus irradiatisoli]
MTQPSSLRSAAMPHRLRRLLALLALALPSVAAAYTTAPSGAQIEQAYQQGKALAKSPDSGYPGGPSLVYAVPDALKLEAEHGAVDAVLAGTPLERTRFQSFLAAIGEDPITAQQARERANVPDHTLTFIVYAHGSTPEDKNFQNQFSAAQLQLGNQTFKSSSIEKSETSTSLYPKTVGEIGVRDTGLVIYHFSIPDKLAQASGTLRFTDSTGKTFKLPVNLSKYP